MDAKAAELEVGAKAAAAGRGFHLVTASKRRIKISNWSIWHSAHFSWVHLKHQGWVWHWGCYIMATFCRGWIFTSESNIGWWYWWWFYTCTRTRGCSAFTAVSLWFSDLWLSVLLGNGRNQSQFFLSIRRSQHIFPKILISTQRPVGRVIPAISRQLRIQQTSGSTADDRTPSQLQEFPETALWSSLSCQRKKAVLTSAATFCVLSMRLQTISVCPVLHNWQVDESEKEREGGRESDREKEAKKCLYFNVKLNLQRSCQLKTHSRNCVWLTGD